jgi:hypothetical protein
MKLEANPLIIESLVVQQGELEHTLNTETSHVSNLREDNLKRFMAEAMSIIIKGANPDLEKICGTLVYTVGSNRFLYQVTLSDKGVEEYSTNPNVEAEILSRADVDKLVDDLVDDLMDEYFGEDA